ncbi:hypothetical protein ILUMI_10585 [Ignelater luminosus]|uniref:Uncharacterized protein n=1 Tax=Ignelater luminosus TaxID=2038154 RepID=A0A8K0G8J5_IGNLU|nr:hypothetical protein ILUMI_10585 [Ignelater luminosus]
MGGFNANFKMTLQSYAASTLFNVVQKLFKFFLKFVYLQCYRLAKKLFVGVEFEDGAVALVNATWLTPRKKEIQWPPYKTQFEYNKALLKAEVYVTYFVHFLPMFLRYYILYTCTFYLFCNFFLNCLFSY